MDLFCCYTPAHEVLFTDHFLPSVPDAFSVVPARLEISGPGDFLSDEFLRCIHRKIDLILESLRANAGGVIAWSDVDIRFFDARPDTLLAELGPHDIAFQREDHRTADVNAGFFVCRCNERVAAFFGEVKTRLRGNACVNEQMVINELLQAHGVGPAWTYLPFGYYARSHGWPPPRRLALYHANATCGSHGVQQKIGQFRDLAFLRRFGTPALILTSMKFVPKRLGRLWSERFAAPPG